MKTVILAAGFGSRLWPLSTSERPKQFQDLVHGNSLLQHTYALLNQVVSTDELYVLTLSGLEHLVSQQLPGISAKNIIIVPERRNTLPHTLFALNSVELSEYEPVLFAPVDHYFADPSEFLDDLKVNIERLPNQVSETYLLCTKTNTIDKSLGYVLFDEDTIVTKFVEKPHDLAAKELAEMGNAYISTLRYITSIAAFKTLLDAVENEVTDLAKQLINATPDQRNENFLAMPMIDISHGLFEKTRGLKALPVRGDFIDIGKFSTLHQINEKDAHGNVAIGLVVLDDESRGNFVINQLDHPLVVVNTQNSVIVQTPYGSVTSPLKDADRVGYIYKNTIL